GPRGARYLATYPDIQLFQKRWQYSDANQLTFARGFRAAALFCANTYWLRHQLEITQNSWTPRCLHHQGSSPNPSQEMLAKDVEKAVNAIFDEIKAALAGRDRVELRGFGSFTVKTWPARTGRNPKTGTKIRVAEAHHPSIRMSKEMHARL